MNSTFHRETYVDTSIEMSHRSLPSRALGMTIREFLATEPHVSEFWTPLIALDGSALEHNLRVMAEWCSARGFELMPHGKTTMAPALWQRQLDAGCTGITVATAGQLRTARSLGFTDLMVANVITDPQGIRYVAEEIADAGVTVISWIDSVAALERTEAALQGVEQARPLDVCVELGAMGGRTGARGLGEALELAHRIIDSPKLRLVGVAGYEGCLGHSRDVADLTAVRAYLKELTELTVQLADDFECDTPIVTAGGSAYFDLVADAFETAMAEHPRIRWVLRSGAYLTHDGGFYRGISPIDAERVGGRDGFRSALTGYASVVSQPEAGLALANAGKRDFPFDEGMPRPVSMADHLGASERPLAAEVRSLNDQHAFVSSVAGDEPAVGDVIRFELSHPCTSFDKWKMLPVVDHRASGNVIDLVATYF